MTDGNPLDRDVRPLALAGALAALNGAVHVLAAMATRQPRAGGLVASAQLGVPAALIALGLPEHVITPAQAAAIMTAAPVSVLVCPIGGARLRGRSELPSAAALSGAQARG